MSSKAVRHWQGARYRLDRELLRVVLVVGLLVVLWVLSDGGCGDIPEF